MDVKIEKTMDISKEMIAIKVKDNGIGIARNKIDTIFKPFNQSDQH